MSKLTEALRFQGRFGHETEDQMRARKVKERIAAADELESLAASHQRLKEALTRLFLAADETGAVFAATEDEPCAAANDPDAEAIGREQAAAVLQCREALRSAP